MGSERVVIQQESQPKTEQADLEPPKMYRVLLLNDDYTPMEFVVSVLMIFFSKNPAEATEIMMCVHQQGKGECAVYTKDVAETKAAQVNEFSRRNEYPLLCIVEQI